MLTMVKNMFSRLWVTWYYMQNLWDTNSSIQIEDVLYKILQIIPKEENYQNKNQSLGNLTIAGKILLLGINPMQRVNCTQ